MQKLWYNVFAVIKNGGWILMVEQAMLAIVTGVSCSRGIVGSFVDQKRIFKESHRSFKKINFSIDTDT